jgi:hypothetical protein
MSSGFRRDLLIFAAALILSAHASSAGAHQKGLTVDESQVVETVSTIFAAARTDDIARFNSVIAPEFYMFDGGARFDGNAIMALIKA